MEIRPELASDAPMISSLISRAFVDAVHSEGTEAQIVERLRAAGALSLALVAEVDGNIVGHICFSPVTIDGEDRGWFGLGPIAVQPDCQSLGIGSKLIREGLDRLAASEANGCVVLGEPDYYGRFGFRSRSQLTYAGPPPQYFQVLAIASEMPSGKVAYHPAFG